MIEHDHFAGADFSSIFSTHFFEDFFNFFLLRIRAIIAIPGHRKIMILCPLDHAHVAGSTMVCNEYCTTTLPTPQSCRP